MVNAAAPANGSRRKRELATTCAPNGRQHRALSNDNSHRAIVPTRFRARASRALIDVNHRALANPALAVRRALPADRICRRAATLHSEQLSVHFHEGDRSIFPRREHSISASSLLDNPRLVSQFAALERRSTPVGRDRVDHGPGGRDDCCNAAALALSAPATGYLHDMNWVRGDEPLPYRHPFFDQLGGLARLR